MISAWSRAAELAARTPPSRNRYVDLLRAVSILAVVFGHWTAAAPYETPAGELRPTHVLAAAGWTHWLTWGIQVMPVFFIVGGFSNGITWRAARRDGKGYAAWLEARLKRLVGPVLVLLVLWTAIGVLAHLGGMRPVLLRVGSQMALIPTWFLAVYVGIVALVPLTHAAWERWGLASIAFLAAAAVLVDLAFFAGLRWLGWVNYLFVWSAVHQLGYAWHDGRVGDVRRAWLWGLAGLALLVLLTELGPYPRSMVGVPDEPLSNTTPPKVVLLALAAAQGGLLLSLQGAGRRWLERPAPWTATVLVNGMIMTVYLWHMTVMVLVIGLAHLLGGAGLHLVPASGAWWITRPVWLAVLGLCLLPLVLLLGRFERPKERPGPPPAAARLVFGAALVCLGLALLSLHGIGGDGWLGLRPVVLGMPFLGALLVGARRRA